jgi:hypothetical protein
MNIFCNLRMSKIYQFNLPQNNLLIRTRENNIKEKNYISIT